MHKYYHLFTSWLQAHPQWGAVVAFIVAFTECIPVIGTIVPGSITMTAIGVFIGSGIMPLSSTLACAVLGAVAGDSIGLLIGYYYRDSIEQVWPFRKYPQWLTRGKKFIAEHGGKSVFIGRFVGPVRALVPLLAGMLHIPPARFYLVDILSAICWAVAYMLPGFLLGIASLEIPADEAAKVILLVLAILIAIWLITWLLRLLSNFLYQTLHNTMNNIWLKLAKSKRGAWVCKLLSQTDPEGHSTQLTLASIFCVLVLLFLILWANVLTSGPLTHWNQAVFHLARGLHDPYHHYAEKLMLLISTLGNRAVIIPTGLCLALYLGVKRQWRAAWYAFLLVALSTGAVLFFKTIAYNPRPPVLFHGPSTSSFPSGHTALSIAIYGFIGYLLANAWRSWRKTIYWCVAGLCLLVALSRIYLCAHWLTDIVGSFLLGMSILLFVVILYRREKKPILNPWGLLLSPLIGLLIVGGVYRYHTFSVQLKNYQLIWPHYELTEQNWWDHLNSRVPLYRDTRLGEPGQVLNVQWANSIDNIVATLAANNWNTLPIDSFVTLVKHVTNEDQVHHVAIIEKLEDDQSPAYIGIHNNGDGPSAVLFLWPANITLMPNSTPLWVGAVYYHDTTHHHLLSKKPVTNLSAIEALIPSLKEYDYKEALIPSSRLPLKLSRSLPDEQVILFVRNKTNITSNWLNNNN